MKFLDTIRQRRERSQRVKTLIHGFLIGPNGEEWLEVIVDTTRAVGGERNWATYEVADTVARYAAAAASGVGPSGLGSSPPDFAWSAATALAKLFTQQDGVVDQDAVRAKAFKIVSLTLDVKIRIADQGQIPSEPGYRRFSVERGPSR